MDTKQLSDIIREQSERIAELQKLLDLKSYDESLINKIFMDRMQREFFNGKPKKLKLSRKPHKSKPLKSKQDKLALIKQRTNSIKKKI
jgi:hypothetical protein